MCRLQAAFYLNLEGLNNSIDYIKTICIFQSVSLAAQIYVLKPATLERAHFLCGSSASYVCKSLCYQRVFRLPDLSSLFVLLVTFMDLNIGLQVNIM